MDRTVELRPVRSLSGILYDYRKGVRHLFMLTLHPRAVLAVCKRLNEESIDYHLQRVGEAKVNLFFGRAPYVETVRRLVTKPLYRLSPEQDFILGTLLGYDREQQCLRYLGRLDNDVSKVPALAAE